MLSIDNPGTAAQRNRPSRSKTAKLPGISLSEVH